MYENIIYTYSYNVFLLIDFNRLFPYCKFSTMDDYKFAHIICGIRPTANCSMILTMPIRKARGRGQSHTHTHSLTMNAYKYLCDRHT